MRSAKVVSTPALRSPAAAACASFLWYESARMLPAKTRTLPIKPRAGFESLIPMSSSYYLVVKIFDVKGCRRDSPNCHAALSDIRRL
ncbi:exported hypothetical protein [Candidatus Sulfopaludibacter sp. SbA4]|nr:exported hypothetical protein [Candidatus Sulfopaludibacter sp. SbA4]